jgi:hypothetical protein
MVTAAETAGGIGLLLGLLTPLAACAVIAAMIDAWAVNVSAATFWSEPFNVPFLVAVGAAALLFTGAGAYSVDARIFGRWRFSPRGRVGFADSGGWRGAADLDIAERDEPDPLHRPGRLAKGCLRPRKQTQKPLIMGVSRGFCVCSACFGLLAGSS